MKMLVLFLASWLVLAQSATLAPEVIELGKPILQEEISPAEIPREVLLQRPLDNDELGEFDIPLLVNGEPQTRLSSPLNPRGRRPGCSSAFGCTRNPPRYRLDEFPPAQPNVSNIGNICNEGRRKLSYGPWNLPQTGFAHLSRQGDALNSMEGGMGQCCRLSDSEKLPCCQSVWENVLTQYCKQEFSVKTRPHFCCKVPAGEDRYGCFARLAPYPAYDQEIQQVNLGQVTPDLLDSLCGQFTLLTKQRNIPALVQNITEPCCKLQGNERTQCAEDVKSQFIVALCSSQKKTWKDPKQCCSQLEGADRSNCFNVNYLNKVSLASAAQTTRPTVPVPPV